MPLFALLLKGYLLGWSVAWPPGPVNAEMIRRGLTRGFLPAWMVGLGACSADFLWALAVAFGAGAIVNVPGVRLALSGVSAALLLLLACIFARAAWRAWTEQRISAGVAVAAPPARLSTARDGYFLGFGMALTSPWNIAFWLAVIGAQTGPMGGLANSLLLAIAVVAGAISWSVFFCTALSFGARFATPAWQIATPAATAALLFYFAVHAIYRLATGG